MDEKRKSQRVKVSFIVLYKVNSPLTVRMMVGDREVNAIALDLSEEGMAVLTNYEIPISTVVTVKFIVLNDAATSSEERLRSMEIDAEVRYSLFTKERAYRLGITFLNISGDERNFIAKFIKMNS